MWCCYTQLNYNAQMSAGQLPHTQRPQESTKCSSICPYNSVTAMLKRYTIRYHIYPTFLLYHKSVLSLSTLRLPNGLTLFSYRRRTDQLIYTSGWTERIWESKSWRWNAVWVGVNSYVKQRKIIIRTGVSEWWIYFVIWKVLVTVNSWAYVHSY